jgi:hypothetical protein
MEKIGIDLHKKESQLCIITDEGEVIEMRIRTERGRFAEMLGGRGRGEGVDGGLYGERVGGAGP